MRCTGFCFQLKKIAWVVSLNSCPWTMAATLPMRTKNESTVNSVRDQCLPISAIGA
jgi:hypothetical protein